MAWVALGLVACAARATPVAPANASRGAEDIGREQRHPPLVAPADGPAVAVQDGPKGALEDALETALADVTPLPPPTPEEVAARRAEIDEEIATNTRGPLEVQLASLQVIEDCPDLARLALRSVDRNRRIRECMPSTVQLLVRGAVSGPGEFRVEAVRVLDARTRKLHVSGQLREPRVWNAEDQRYEAWDGRVAPWRSISYGLAIPQVAGVVEPPSLVIEIDVAIDGRRWTLRAGPTSRQDPDQMIT